MIILRSILLFAPLIGLGLGSNPVIAQVLPASRVREKIDLGRYREAERTLRAGLRQREDGSSRDGRHAQLMLLVEVYYQSCKYELAAAALESAGRHLADQARRHPAQDFTVARLEAALWRARVRLAQAKAASGLPLESDSRPGQSVAPAEEAPSTLEDDPELSRLRVDLAAVPGSDTPPAWPREGDFPEAELSWAARADRLEWLVLEAELADVRAGEVEPRASRQARWQPIQAIGERLFGQTQGRAELIAAHRKVARRWARSLEAGGQADRARAVLLGLLGSNRAAAPAGTREEIWTEVARLDRRAGNHRDEVAAWRAVLETHRDTSAQGRPSGILAEVHQRNAQALIHLELAEALHFAGAEAESFHEQAQSTQIYQRSLERIKQAAVDPGEEAEFDWQKVATLQGLLQSHLARQRWQNRQEAVADAEVLSVARELLERLQATRVPGDAAICQTEAIVATQCLRNGDLAESRKHLEDVLKHTSRYRPGAAALRVNLLAVRADVSRAEGKFRDAEVQWEEAVGLYRRAKLQDKNLELWLQVYRGRLWAAEAAFGLAETAFQNVVRRARLAGPSAGEAEHLAHLGLAMLFKGFGRLKEAERECRLILPPGAAGSPSDSAVLPYRLALASILVARKTAEAAAEVQAAQEVAREAHGEQSREYAETLHLAALLTLMRYEKDESEATAETADKLAEKLRQDWSNLSEVQHRRGWSVEEARSCYFLSRLAYLRWSREAKRERMRLAAYDRRYRTYEATRRAYQNDLDKYDADSKRYEADLARWERMETQKRDSLGKDLKDRWDQLSKLREKLRSDRNRLRAEQVDLDALYPEANAAGGSLATKPTATASNRMSRSRPAPQRLGEADRWAQRAIGILEPCGLCPNLHYLALCQRAEILRARAGWEASAATESLTCLHQAVALLEQPRVSFLEGDVTRAEFLEQYGEAFDRLVEWHRQTDPAQALVYAELCRSRAFLDRLRSDGYAPGRVAVSTSDRAQSLPSLLARTEQLAVRIGELSRQLHEIDALGGQTPSAAAKIQQQKDDLRRRLQAARQEYAGCQDQILQNSSLGRIGLGRILDRGKVEAMVKRRASGSDLTLYYHVGTSETYLFVLGLEAKIQVFRLTSPEVGSDLRQSLPARTVEAWVEDYHRALATPGGFFRASEKAKGHWAEMAACLLPISVLERVIPAVQARGGHLIISPDGALQRIPFEALLLEAGTAPQFLVDRLPAAGIAYVPSLMILESLQRPLTDRRKADSLQPAGLMTVACADFSALRSAGAAARVPAVADLPALASAFEESSRVAGAFQASSPVCQCLGTAATEGRFRLELRARRPAIVHLATHAVAIGSQSGGATALVFHPGPSGSDESDDGLLESHEIYSLPLDACELAALGACRTGGGQTVAGEMTFSVARAFLAAGARRVLASHWSLEDDAGCKLVSAFLSRVAEGQKDQGFDYASALRWAREKLRRAGGLYCDPYYWAPLVLIGPGQPAR